MAATGTRLRPHYARGAGDGDRRRARPRGRLTLREDEMRLLVIEDEVRIATMAFGPRS
jgi:hypothetical protein